MKKEVTEHHSRVVRRDLYDPNAQHNYNFKRLEIRKTLVTYHNDPKGRQWKSELGKTDGMEEADTRNTAKVEWQDLAND